MELVNVPFSRDAQRLDTAGPRLIAIGLAVLIAAAWIPHLPVVTALAVLTLGATSVTLVRFRHSPALLPMLLLHGATYAAMYALFVGATLDLAAKSLAAASSLITGIDVAASLLVMAAAAFQIFAALRRV